MLYITLDCNKDNKQATMDIETIVDNKNFTLRYYSKEKIIHHQFHDYVYGSKLHEYLFLGVELMKKYGAQKWLSDDRENPILSPEDVQYGKEIWTPAAKAAGWKYWALILPEAMIGKLSMQQYLDYNRKNGIIVELFHDPEPALQWLKSI